MNIAGLENRDDSVAPGRLRSLLDIMKRFSVAQFLQISAMGGIAYTRMQYDKLYDKHHLVNEKSYNILTDSGLAANIVSFEYLENECIELELTCALATVKRIQIVLDQPNPSYTTLHPLLLELQERLVDETHPKIFLALSIRESELYNNSRNGWEKIIERFQDAVTDVEEASKCFALSRYAASVFHSTQVVEAGLISLGIYIGVNDPRSGWTAVTNKLTAIIRKAHMDRTDFEKQNFSFLEQIQGTVEALKNAWRNKIGHAQGRLTLMSKDFSPEIAEEILFASRAFMRRLADGLPPLEIKSDS
jgi:hypothetical protein